MAKWTLGTFLKDGSLTGQVVNATCGLFLLVFLGYAVTDWSLNSQETADQTEDFLVGVDELMQLGIQNLVDHNNRAELIELMRLINRHPLVSGISLTLDDHRGEPLSLSEGTFAPEPKTFVISLLSHLPGFEDQVVVTSTLRGPLGDHKNWVAAVNVNFNINALYSSHEALVTRFLVDFSIIICIVIFLGTLFHKRILKPILGILDAMKAQYSTDITMARFNDIEPVGQRDLDQLIFGFNHYQRSLQAAHDAQKNQIIQLDNAVNEKTAYLQAALEKSDISEKNHKQIFQMLSHDLKETILTCQFQTEALRRNVNFQYDQEVVTQIARLGQAMGDTYDKLEEILAFSINETSEPDVKIEKIDLYREAETVLDKLGYLATNKGIALDLIFDPSLPGGIEASKDGVRQIINALLSSAIKETAVGGVSIELSKGETILEEAFYLKIIVKASCSPVNLNVMEALRKAADQGVVIDKDNEINAIALRIALTRLREMNGSFEIKTASDITECTLKIPVLSSSDALSIDQQGAKRTTRGKKIVFVVPSIPTLFSKSIISRLTYLGQPVFAVSDANQLSQLVISHPQDKLVLIGQRLCSLEMSESFMPLTEIRQMGLACIISLEHQVNQEEDMLFPSRELADFKQDMMVQMRTLISRAVDHCYPRSDQVLEIFMQQSPILEAETLKDAKILVVDDTTAVLDGMSEYLRSYGAEVITLRSALEAAKRAREEHFDAVCTDISMPQMSGIELGLEIRQSSINARTPIIGMTAAILSEHEMSDTAMVGMTVLNKNGIMDLVLTSLCTQIHKARSGEPVSRGHLRAVAGGLRQEAKSKDGG